MIHILHHQRDEIIGWVDEVIEDSHVQAIKNNEETYEFTISAIQRDADKIKSRTRLLIPNEDGDFREFVVDYTQDRAIPMEKDIVAYGSFVDLQKLKVVNPQVLDGQTVRTAASTVLGGLPWQVGITDHSEVNTWSIEKHLDAYSALKEIASLFEMELRFRVTVDGDIVTGRYVDFIERQGINRGKEIVLGKDLTGITRRVLADRIVTSLHCIGPEREDGTRLEVTVTDDAAYQNWNWLGKHLVQVFEPESNNKDMTAEMLTQLGKEELQKRITAAVEYEVDAVSLEHIFGYEHEITRLGDTARVKDEQFNPPLYLDSRIIYVERSVFDETQKEYKLGEVIEYTEDEVMATWRELQSLYALKIVKSNTAPEGNSNIIWIDTSQVPNISRTWNGTAWVKSTPTRANEILFDDLKTIESLKPAQAGADVTGNNTAANTNNVGDQPAANVAGATVNFNSRNDRISALPANPTVATDGTSVDHTINTDGSADISFEWSFSGTGDAYDIDGFIVYVYQSSSSSAYAFGTTPASETVYFVSAEKRAFILYGVPANRYYTLGIQAYRGVDDDIDSTGFKKSSIVKPLVTGENPYRPSSSVAFAGNISGTVNGVAASTLTTQASNGDAAKTLVDANKSIWDRSGNINSDGTWNTSKLAGDIDTSANAIRASSNFYWYQGTLVAIDPNNSNNIVQISSGGIGISSDGGLNFDTIISGNRVVSKELIATDDETQAIKISQNAITAYYEGFLGGRALLSVEDTVPSMWDGNLINPLIEGYGKMYSQRVNIPVPAASYTDGDYIEATVSIKSYANVAIQTVSAILCQAISKEWYAYEVTGSRTFSGELQSFKIRISPNYAYSSSGTTVSIDLMVIGWR
ncbi:phage tail spike protein [Cytobacillus pseudoceanisediminis]|uniref:phage tail spike protein n=1 Tax=Cytobacillus pseudoceanisediminis TaxID=3051614 RepID=UPI003CF050A7